MKKKLQFVLMIGLSALLIPTSALAATTSTLWENDILDKNKGTYTPIVYSNGKSIEICVSKNPKGNTVKLTPYEVSGSKKTPIGSTMSFSTSSACYSKSLSGLKDGKNKKAEIQAKIVSSKSKTVHVKIKHTY
ncbi:hypothetical protein [Priestia megaterium]|uniref:hypothetical protein n=1 Tax=Priestia megaterium TaxID=1404 RepID=UPI0035A81D1B